MGIILRYKDFLKTYKTRGHRIRHLQNYEKLFPVISSERLAGIIGDLISDGHLQGDPKWRFDFTSKFVDELKRFEKEIYLLFGIKGKIRECKTNKLSKSYNLGINCSPISRILFLCGTPPGQKVLISFKIPPWIKKDKECFRRFAQRLFSCEGSIMHEPHRKFPQIRYTMWKSDGLVEETSFIEEFATYLKKHFNINSTLRKTKRHNIRKDGKVTREYRMYITGESVVKFYNEIGFEGEKQDKLNKIMGMTSGEASLLG